jgi:ATP-dependent exoDNAse (exonuclease V) alpha subunit
MRVHANADSHSFAEWLLDVGHARRIDPTRPSNTVFIKPNMRSSSEHDLIQSVYGSLSQHETVPPPEYFRDRAILAARNKDIHSLNSTILARVPGHEHTYTSADSYTMESPTACENNDVPVEFLHSLNASGLPIAHLTLKVGCPIIILRNIDSKRGLCNGTRATIIQMSNRLLEIRLITGDHAGETALIPRITLSPSLTALDFAIKLNRRQFPIQLAFAMTINKAQGQTLDHIGIDLRNEVFAHGQLYVAFSRATSSKNIKVLLSDETGAQHSSTNTRNIVYQEVLLD